MLYGRQNHISTGLEHYTFRLIVLLSVMRLRVVVMINSIMDDTFVMRPGVTIPMLREHRSWLRQ